ncbi:MAG TPA: hypothetical protein VF015_05200 [Acidimicrobiales bacterium]
MPARPLRVLIEDPALMVDDLATPTTAIDVTACSGPRDEREMCPLVMDGTCPLGPCDIVVSALTGPWAPSVRAAWAETSTPVVDAVGLTATDPAERLQHHIGAAIQRLWATYRATE